MRMSERPVTQREALKSYLAPISIFAIFTTAESWLPLSWYPFIYGVQIVCIIGALLTWRTSLADIRWSPRLIVPAFTLGLTVLAAWIMIDKLLPYPHLGNRVGFNPFAIPSPIVRDGFLATRFLGLVVVVPVMEELLWRSFLLRYLTGIEFLAVPIGTFTSEAFAGMVAVSAMAHPEWLVAIIASAAYGWLVFRTRSIFAAIVAHATTNAGLGVYILVTKNWKYW
jgi:CAAX prenyl protease-like protein